jgi:hypothetical protein
VIGEASDEVLTVWVHDGPGLWVEAMTL